MGIFTAFAGAAYVGCGSGELNLLPLGPDAGEAGDAAKRSEGGDARAEACMNGSCPCGLSSCDGGCYDLQSDPQHCGTCTMGCNHGAYCHAATCECLPGHTACPGSTCIDTAADPNNCGGCGVVCDAGQSCELGCHNTAGKCSGSLTACPATNGRVECADLDASLPYCGSCGNVCGPDQVCAIGSCQTYAPSTPCSRCPCSCDVLVGMPSTCCPGLAGGTRPICVHGTSCP
jgi:hypothetical protein